MSEGTGESLRVALSASVIAAVPTGTQVAVAYSGGRDSTALLHAAVTTLRPLGYTVCAIHVHHGLSPNADAWASHCETVAARLAVPLTECRVVVPKDHGIEAGAREARYRALARCDVAAVLLAHHRDDQAETLLLQLLRGAGVHGLAAMGSILHRHGMRFLRPWLQIPRSTIDAYHAEHALAHVEDESNQDVRFTRNRLRHRVWPTLLQAFPEAAAALSQSASVLNQARDAIDAWAYADPALRADGALDCGQLAARVAAQQAYIYRAWLQRHGLPLPRAHQLVDVLAQLLQARQDAQVNINVGTHGVRRFQGRAYVVPNKGWDWQPCQWSGEHELALAAATGTVQWFDAKFGVRMRQPLAGEIWQLRQRLPRDVFSLGSDRPHRPLKQQFQVAAVPPWLRNVAPVLTCNGAIAWVGGLGVERAFQAEGDRPGLQVEWECSWLKFGAAGST
jgi:tRNA(Ile)-lysidine synthase